MPQLLSLLVLVSSLLLTINCQLSVYCPSPYKQHPEVPFLTNEVIEARLSDAIGTTTFFVSPVISSIPIITRTLPDKSTITYSTILSISPIEYNFNANMVFVCSPVCPTVAEPVTNHFNFPTNSFEVMASTLTADIIVLVVKNTVDGKVTHANFDATKTNGVFQLKGQTAEYRNTADAPSAIAAINGNHDQFAVFFGAYWAIITSEQLKKPIYIDSSSPNQLRLSRTWIGCPVELCFEGDLDAAAGTMNRIQLFRGQYEFILIPNKMEISTTAFVANTSHHYLDAAFNWLGRTYFIVNDQIVDGNVRFSNASSASRFPINAAFVKASSVETSVVVLSGSGYVNALYDVTNAELYEFENGELEDKWPGLPADIDAAVEWSSSEVIFFKGSFHYQANINGGIVVPRLTMNTLYKCADAFYANYTADINISTLGQFQTYIGKFKPSRSDKPTAQQSSNTWLIILILIIIPIVGLIVFIVTKKKEVPFEKHDSLIEVLFNETSTLQSTGTGEAKSVVPIKPANNATVAPNK